MLSHTLRSSNSRTHRNMCVHRYCTLSEWLSLTAASSTRAPVPQMLFQARSSSTQPARLLPALAACGVMEEKPSCVSPSSSSSSSSKKELPLCEWTP